MKQGVKKLLSKALSVVLAAGMLPVGMAHAGVVTPDGTFETGVAGFRDQAGYANGSAYTLEQDTSESYRGNASAKFTRTSANRAFGMENGYEFEAGKTYKFSAAIKADKVVDGMKAIIQLYGSPNGDIVVDDIPIVINGDGTVSGWYRKNLADITTTDWVYLEESFSISGADVLDARVGVNILNDGASADNPTTFWVDDFAVSEVVTYEDVTADGDEIIFDSFEGDVDNWGMKTLRPDAALTVNYKDSVSGIASASIYQAGSGNTGLQSNEIINLEVGSTYRVTAFAKPETNDGKKYMQFELYGQNQDVVVNVSGAEYISGINWYRSAPVTIDGTNWKKYDWSFKVTSDDEAVTTCPVKLGVWVTGGDAITYYVDDVKVTKLGAEEMPDNNFQFGSGAWEANFCDMSVSKDYAYGMNTHSLKAGKKAGYSSLTHEVNLEKDKFYTMKAKFLVPEFNNNETVDIALIMAGEKTNNTQNATVAAYEVKTVKPGEWVELEKNFFMRKATGTYYLNMITSFGNGSYFYLNDVEVTEGVENNVNVKDGNASWYDYGRAYSENTSVVVPGNNKSLYVQAGSASYTLTLTNVKVKDNTKYHATAKLYVPDTGLGLNGEEYIFYSLSKIRTVNETDMLAYGKVLVDGYDKWIDIEFDYEHDQDAVGTDELILEAYARGGNVSSKAYYIGEATFDKVNKTANITEVSLNENYIPSVTLNTEDEYILAYRYYADNEIVEGGYVQKGEQIPVIDKAYTTKDIVLEVIAVLEDGTVEESVFSGKVEAPEVKPVLNVTAISILDNETTEPVASIADAINNGVYAGVEYTTNIDTEADLYIAYYDEYEKLIDVEVNKLALKASETYVEYPEYNEENPEWFTVPEGAACARLFLWDSNNAPLVENAFVK